MNTFATFDYARFDAQLQGRNHARRKLANNTYAERRDNGDIAIRLHNTDVVTYHTDGSATLDTDGWLTVTTKARMNEYSPAMVMSDHGRWIVRFNGTTVPYADGLTLCADGTVRGAPADADVVAQDLRNRKVRRDIKRFVGSITPAMILERWADTGGDCWGCKMRADDGSYPMGSSCLADHVKEGYFHASLAHRAISAAGYPNPDVIMAMVYADAERGRVDSLLTRSLAKLLRKSLVEGVAVV